MSSTGQLGSTAQEWGKLLASPPSSPGTLHQQQQSLQRPLSREDKLRMTGQFGPTTKARDLLNSPSQERKRQWMETRKDERESKYIHGITAPLVLPPDPDQQFKFKTVSSPYKELSFENLNKYSQRFGISRVRSKLEKKLHVNREFYAPQGIDTSNFENKFVPEFYDAPVEVNEANIMRPPANFKDFHGYSKPGERMREYKTLKDLQIEYAQLKPVYINQMNHKRPLTVEVSKFAYLDNYLGDITTAKREVTGADLDASHSQLQQNSSYEAVTFEPLGGGGEGGDGGGFGVGGSDEYINNGLEDNSFNASFYSAPFMNQTDLHMQSVLSNSVDQESIGIYQDSRYMPSLGGTGSQTDPTLQNQFASLELKNAGMNSIDDFSKSFVLGESSVFQTGYNVDPNKGHGNLKTISNIDEFVSQKFDSRYILEIVLDNSTDYKGRPATTAFERVRSRHKNDKKVEKKMREREEALKSPEAAAERKKLYGSPSQLDRIAPLERHDSFSKHFEQIGNYDHKVGIGGRKGAGYYGPPTSDGKGGGMEPFVGARRSPWQLDRGDRGVLVRSPSQLQPLSPIDHSLNNRQDAASLLRKDSDMKDLYSLFHKDGDGDMSFEEKQTENYTGSADGSIEVSSSLGGQHLNNYYQTASLVNMGQFDSNDKECNNDINDKNRGLISADSSPKSNSKANITQYSPIKASSFPVEASEKMALKQQNKYDNDNDIANFSPIKASEHSEYKNSSSAAAAAAATSDYVLIKPGSNKNVSTSSSKARPLSASLATKVDLNSSIFALDSQLKHQIYDRGSSTGSRQGSRLGSRSRSRGGTGTGTNSTIDLLGATTTAAAATTRTLTPSDSRLSTGTGIRGESRERVQSRQQLMSASTTNLNKFGANTLTGGDNDNDNDDEDADYAERNMSTNSINLSAANNENNYSALDSPDDIKPIMIPGIGGILPILGPKGDLLEIDFLSRVGSKLERPLSSRPVVVDPKMTTTAEFDKYVRKLVDMNKPKPPPEVEKGIDTSNMTKSEYRLHMRKLYKAQRDKVELIPIIVKEEQDVELGVRPRDHQTGLYYDMKLLPKRIIIELSALRSLYNVTGGKNWRDATGWQFCKMPQKKKVNKARSNFTGIVEKDDAVDPSGGTVELEKINSETLRQIKGVTIDRFNNICELNLKNNKLAGTFPEDIRDLLQLEVLQLNFNKISGPFLGNSIMRLKCLETINVSHNQLSGKIPWYQLCDLPRLRELLLNHNDFEGDIPDFVFTDPSTPKQITADPNNKCWVNTLRNLSLNNNRLTGKIPSTIRFMKKLEVLCLSNNEFSGPLPDGIQSLYLLSTFSIAHNKLTGKPPSYLYSMEFMQQSTCNFEGNLFDEC